MCQLICYLYFLDYCSPNPCNPNGECLGIPGGFNCKCDDGYSGDTCEIGK